MTSTEKTNKYLYAGNPPNWLIQLLCGVVISCWLLVIYGYLPFVRPGLLYWWSIFPFILFFSVYYFARVSLKLLYPTHKRRIVPSG